MDSIATSQSSQSKASEDVVLELEYEIEEDVEAELEDFVRLSHSGQFKDAHKLYDECLSGYDSWYPIAAEYADCLLREGDFQQLVTFSRKARLRFQDRSERKLLRLMEVIGNRTPDKKLMWHKLADLWPVSSMKPPYNSLSDTEVHLLEIGLQILVLTGEDPKDLDARLASDHTSSGPYGAFKDWYFYLLHHEYFWEAQRILHSLLHKVSLLECKDMVNDYIKKAVSTNIGQESVQIAASSLVQRFVYVIESKFPSPLDVVQWNDAIHWALFGVTLAGAGEESISLVSRICMRPYLRQRLKYNRLPLDGVNSGNDDMFESLNEAVKKRDVSMMRQAVIAEPIRYTEDELNSMILLKAAQHFFLREGNQLFLNPRTVDARDGFWRTSLHWASLNADLQAVELLLSKGEADACLLDWFGCMPLHYAVRSRAMKRDNIRVVESLLKSDSATVNTRDSSGRTPLRIAILSRNYEMAETLLRHGATVETSDYSVLLLPQLEKDKVYPQSERKELSEWQELLSRYDHPQPSVGDSSSDVRPFVMSSNSNSATELGASMPPGVEWGSPSQQSFFPSLRKWKQANGRRYPGSGG